jgi:hypothetical protein
MTSWNSTFKNPGKPMKRTSIKRTKPMATGLTGVLAVASTQRTTKAKGLHSKQRPVTPEEKALWSRMAREIGCVACLLDGHPNTYVSIHHIDGRTKPGCHKKVLPLCAGHHQDGTGEDKTMIAVHPWVARFEERYGTQAELLGRVMRVLGSIEARVSK